MRIIILFAKFGNLKPQRIYERHCTRRRQRNPPLSYHERGFQAVAAYIRQTNGLLPCERAYACGNQGYTDYFHASGPAVLRRLFGDGSAIGVRFSYAEQPSPDGLAQAFIIGKQFVGDDSVCLVLGDNIFYGSDLTSKLLAAVEAAEKRQRATVFGYWVDEPQRYGVAEFSPEGKCLSIEEKPQHPKSNYAVVGLYFYPNKVLQVASEVKPSARGELEITSVNQRFLQDGELDVQALGRGFAWLDTGTHDSLADASIFVETIEKRTGLKIACLEEIAFEKGWISAEELRELALPMAGNAYGKYLLKLAEKK